MAETTPTVAAERTEEAAPKTKEEIAGLLRTAVIEGRTRDSDIIPLVTALLQQTAKDESGGDDGATSAVVDLTGCGDATVEVLRAASVACPQVKRLVLDLCGPRILTAATEESLRAAVAPMCPSLESISLSFARVPEKSLLFLASLTLPSLASVSLRGCSGATETALGKLVAHFGATIERLDVSHCKTVTTSVVRRIAHGMPRLRSLDLSWCSDFGDPDKLAKHLTGLVSIGVAASKITDSTLAKLLAANPSLSSLDVSHCPAVMQNPGEKSIKAMANITRLAIGNVNLTDATLAKVVQSTPKLVELDITGSDKITPEGLRAALVDPSVAKSLRILTMGFCKAVSEFGERADVAIAEIRKALPELAINFVRTSRFAAVK